MHRFIRLIYIRMYMKSAVIKINGLVSSLVVQYIKLVSKSTENVE